MRATTLCFAVLGITACATAPAKPEPAQEMEPAVAAVTAAPAPAAEQRRGLLFEVEPTQAELFIDSNRVGRIAELAGGFLKLDPGIYKVSLKLDGYSTWRAEVTVRDELAEKIQVTLVAK